MQTKRLKTTRNDDIAYFEMLSDESDICIVLVHGLAEHKGRYVELINKLHSLKYSVFAPDLIGHGESSGPRGDIKNFDIFINELEEFISHIKKNHPKMKIVLFGHSLGGLISCCYAAKFNNIDLLVLSNPLLERKKNLNVFCFLPYKMLSFIKIKKRHSESKAMLEYSRKDPLSCKTMSLRLLGEILVTGINYLSKNISSITVPLLLLGGSEDNVVKSKNLPNIISYFGSIDKTFKIYEGVKHRLVHSPKKDKVIEDIDIWIHQRLK